MTRKALLLAAALLLIFVATTSATTPTTITVTGTLDGALSTAACTQPASGADTCPTLRDAIGLANSLPGSATITLGAGTYTLTNGSLNPAEATTINGAGTQGSSATTITGPGPGSAIVATANLTLTNLVMNAEECGEVSSPSGASITLQGVTITNGECAATAESTPGATGGNSEGAAIDASLSLVTLTNSVISNNTDIGGAGGPGSGSTAGGTGGGAGGAILAEGLVMSGSVVTGNTSTGGAGGTGTSSAGGGTGGVVSGAGFEVVNTGGPLTLSITNSLISDNTSTGGAGGGAGAGEQGGGGGAPLGGGLYVYAGGTTSTPATITGTTFTGDVVSTGQPGNDTNAGAIGGNGNYAGGGGVYTTGIFPLRISGSTFTANEAIGQSGGHGAGSEVGYPGEAQGAGLYVQNGATLTMVNSTVVANIAQSGSGAAGTPGTLGSFGGGIDAYGDPGIYLYSDTISGNSVPSGLGATTEFGANLLEVGTSIYLASTVVANALPTGAVNCAGQSGGAFVDDGYDLEDANPGTCGLGASGKHDQLGASGLPVAAPSTNGAAGIAASGSAPAIPAPTTLAPAAGSLLIGNGGACLNPFTISALTTDERGAVRPTACDIGALQSEPLKVTGTPAITGTTAVGQTLTCSTGTFTTSGDGAIGAGGAIGGPSISYSWTSGQTTLATTGTYTVAASEAGKTITCTETATGAYGHGSATSAAVAVPKLALTALKQRHKAWSETKHKHGPPRGTAFTYTLNAPATVTLTFAKATTGRRVGKRCVAEKRKNARKRHCTFYARVGALKHSSHQGTTTLSFTGKLGKHLLKPGTYAVTVTASAGGGTTGARTLKFTVKR